MEAVLILLTLCVGSCDRDNPLKNIKESYVASNPMPLQDCINRADVYNTKQSVKEDDARATGEHIDGISRLRCTPLLSAETLLQAPSFFPNHF